MAVAILAVFLLTARVRELAPDVPPAVCLGYPPGFMPHPKGSKRQRRIDRREAKRACR